MITLPPQIYTKAQINNAGKILCEEKNSPNEKEQALEIVDHWRAIHSYPLHVFQMRLKNKANKIDKTAFVAQRLKRIPSIIYKLQRRYHRQKPTMNLTQMQDIGGCRAIVSDVSLVKKLYEEHYLKSDIKHKKVGFKDYIIYPKEDGYRGIHLAYEYKSDKNKQQFNGLRIEIQIRSKLQHLWATAIETVDFFTRQAIKTNEGNSDWREFFKLVSSAFARIEHCPLVPHTPPNEQELYSQIKKKATELNVISKMTGWTSAMQIFKNELKPKKKVKFFLLELDIKGEKLIMKSYIAEAEKKAIEEYAALEKRHSGNKEYDVVLVGVDTVNDLEKAYPNYFVDCREFISYLQKIISKNSNHRKL